jgi:Xaa-Pro aminopeptidase
MSETPVRKRRSTLPSTPEFGTYMSSNWDDAPDRRPDRREVAAYAARRRAAVSAQHPGLWLVVPAGDLVQRSNDTDYPFRAHSGFAHLTGWGSDTVPGSVLVLEPVENEEHSATLFFPAAPGRDTTEFFTDARTGEFWTGPRPSLAHVEAELGLRTRPLSELPELLNSLGDDTAVVAEADPGVNEHLSRTPSAASTLDADLFRTLSEIRLVKDDYEIEQMRRAVAATARGFDDIVAGLPVSSGHVRGERVVEGIFHSRARLEGNDVGYATIAASGHHATVLHWEKNDGPVLAGDLLLVDAGVEMDSYYTADITRTVPVGGRFSPVQRRVYEAVLDAADAAFAVTRPGVRFLDVHEAAMAVIASRLDEWGLLTMSVEEALERDNQPHRRYMVHGTSHHLGLDVHDCAQARLELYQEGVLEEGMIFTIEPGLYFQSTDLTVPAEYRGIGVRIEDDILVTADGAENLSVALPRSADDVEAWVSRLTS